MQSDAIVQVGLDGRGRLYVKPESTMFPYIYREAMEVSWDAEGRYLCGPEPPRAHLETRPWWFRQILAAAKEQGVELLVRSETSWHNVSDSDKHQILVRSNA